jgi:pimeloyl-ACP methyl ester carboxylesterase
MNGPGYKPRMVSYDRAGSGEPLVLIHGLGGSRTIWRPVWDRLIQARDVIAVDMPGFGQSPPLPAGVAPTARRLGESVADLCETLGLERPHYAGNSLGAWAALELAKQGRAASVCALSPAGLWRRALGPRRFDSRRLGRRVQLLLPLLMSSSRARAALLRTTLAHPERLDRGEARALVLDWLTAPGYEAANAEMRGAVFEHPEQVEVPTTIAWGSEDRLVAAPRRERMPPGSRFVVLEGCGHTPTWDDPDQVAELLLDTSGGQVSSGASSPGQAPVAR